jgi:hypothetical protein
MKTNVLTAKQSTNQPLLIRNNKFLLRERLNYQWTLSPNFLN